MERIILFYRFTPFKDPEAIRLWQSELCRRLKLKGRLIIASQGINGTLGGQLEDLKAYRRALNEMPALRGIDYKWSRGKAADFPRLSVKVRDELVTLEAPAGFKPTPADQALTPQKWHQYLQAHPETIVLDARNHYESEIGYFKADNLIKAPIKTFKEIKSVLDKLPKAKPILTYCTGDVRCEYLSAYMRSLGFGKVYHLDGGIVKYGQIYGDDGFWQGKCYVFDGRMQIGFSDRAADLANCLVCRKKTSSQVNCDDCNRQLVICSACQAEDYRHCQNPVVSSAQRS